MSSSLLYRIVVVGSGGVGKSCLTLQFVANRFVEDYDPTLEDSYRRQVLAEGKPCVVEILDTAGQDDYAVIREAYYQTGDGFVFVFDVTQKSSILDVVSLYDSVLAANEKLQVPAILVGNKADLLEKRVISKRQGEELARRMGCKYFEASAKEPRQVNEVFYGILNAVVEERQMEMRRKEAEKSMEHMSTGIDRYGRWGRKRSIVKKKLATCTVM